MQGEERERLSAAAVGEISAAIRNVPLFSKLGAESLDVLAGASRRFTVRAGETVVQRGAPADAMYVVLSGMLEVLGGPGDADRIRVMRAGIPFGELALLSGEPRNATVRAVRDCELWELPRSAFDSLLASDGEFARAMVTALTRLVLESEPRGGAQATTSQVIAVVPLHDDAPVAPVVEAFAATLGDARVAVCRPRREVEHETWASAVERLEHTSDFVLLVAAPERDAWFDFCVRAADRVVAVARAGARMSKLDLTTAPDVVLFGTPGARGIEPALAVLSPRAHHLVDPNEAGVGTARAVRRIVGQSIGIVLSGGGARGLAHLGVLEELAKAGVVVERFGGTSMGGLVAALAASGMPPEDIRESLHREFVDRRPFSDYAIPRVALLRGRKVHAMLERLFGESRIEEMPHSFFCLSADLASAAPVIHRTGRVATAIGASMALPGVAPPVLDGDRMLVDGGILDNLPVATMAASAEGPVIAVDVLARGMPGARTRSRGGRDGGLPSIVEILARSSTLASRSLADAQRALASHTIVPDLEGVSLVEFGQFDAIVEAGRRATVEMIERGLDLTVADSRD